MVTHRRPAGASLTRTSLDSFVTSASRWGRSELLSHLLRERLRALAVARLVGNDLVEKPDLGLCGDDRALLDLVSQLDSLVRPRSSDWSVNDRRR
jgi:hypothetical protein